MNLIEIKEKGDLLNQAIEIIEKLSENGLGDVDGGLNIVDMKHIDNVKGLIIDARSLTADRWWNSLR